MRLNHVKILMERIRQIDAVMDARGGTQLHQTLQLSTIDHEDSHASIRELALELEQKFEPELSADELYSYEWLQVYLDALAFAQIDEELDRPEDVAERYGLEWEQFEPYIVDRSEKIHGHEVACEGQMSDEDWEAYLQGVDEGIARVT